MGGTVFLICFFSAMTLWDFTIKFLNVISTPLARRYEQKRVSRYADILFALARITTGMKIDRPPKLPENLPESFLIICNHQSFIDIAYLLYLFPEHKLRFVAKESLARGIPYASHLFRLQQHALISRKGNIRFTIEQLHKLADRFVNNRWIPVVFPEGTRSKTGELGRFHSGAVRTILTKRPVPVLCIAIDGGYTVSDLSTLGKMMGQSHYKTRFLRLFPAPKNSTEIEAMLTESKGLIKKQLIRWRSNKKPAAPVKGNAGK